MGRPQGTYITIEAPELSTPDEDYHREISLEIARHLQNVINLERELSILVVGLGNSAITADSLGPHVVENLHITRHMIREYGLQSLGKEKMHRISGIIPGVMAQTGMETAEIVRGVVRESRPDLVMLDEPSLGLAPLLVREIFDIILKINAEGKTVLLVEQNALAALSIAHYAYVLEVGRVVAEAPGQELLKDPKVKEAYLGG